MNNPPWTTWKLWTLIEYPPFFSSLTESTKFQQPLTNLPPFYTTNSTLQTQQYKFNITNSTIQPAANMTRPMTRPSSPPQPNPSLKSSGLFILVVARNFDPTKRLLERIHWFVSSSASPLTPCTNLYFRTCLNKDIPKNTLIFLQIGVCSSPKINSMSWQQYWLLKLL